MPVTSETVSVAGSGLVFENTYEAGVTDAYRASIISAESYLASHFSDAVTIRIDFATASLASDHFIADNEFSVVRTSYATLQSALANHATTADDAIAVAGLPFSDPSGGTGFSAPTAYARMLGLGFQTPDTDQTVNLSTDVFWSYGQDVVGALIHEISEGGMGRVGSLGLDFPRWFPMDLFRFTATGARDFTGGSDGVATFFGIDAAHVSSLELHNSFADGTNDGQDLADWDSTSDDAFGPGGPGAQAVVSPTDLQVLDVLGWTPWSGPSHAAGPDDFASAFADASRPFGQVAVGGTASGMLESAGDRDWFKVTLGEGNFVITLTGADGGGGSLADPFLRVYDDTGALVRQADDIIPGQDHDARLVIHIGVAGTFYVEAGSNLDVGTGSYTVSVGAGAAASTTGDDLLAGDISGATLSGDAGNDTIDGRDAPNHLLGGDGDDVINGGAAFDNMNGNKGDDTVHGGEGNDWVLGGQNEDVLFGDDGDDFMNGNLGNDTLSGGFGADTIRGGQGDDTIVGGDGNDWISGDRGDDTISGGAGADTFHSFSGAGKDVVTDFNFDAGDRVQLDAGTTFTVSQVGADTVIDMGGGDQLILKGVQLSTLPPESVWIFEL